MSSYYDIYGTGAYSQVTAGYHSLTTTYGSGGWGNGEYIKKNERPAFKSLFTDPKYFDPANRKYIMPPGTHSVPTDIHSPPTSYPKLFDKKKIELITVQKDGKNFTTLSDETINYLKNADMKYVETVAWLIERRNFVQNTLNNLPAREYQQKPYLKENLNYLQNLLNQAELDFQNFVGNLGETLIDLNRPFLYEGSDNGSENNKYPISISNVSAYELDGFINSIFGNVTGDNFVPIANGLIYDAKQPTSCCIEYCFNKDYYRMKDVPYKESEQKTQDDIEFEKYKNSSYYEPYSPPSNKFQEIKLDTFMRMFNEGKNLVNSPISYLFDKLKPFLNEFEDSHGWFKYKIVDNNVNIDLDFR
ncbi:hypothetical protein [Arcobacter sp. F2176]|uniref:hypothetical protein n=1 Tax=Arcobacter sp. F2176 TaxID=2044511 RepID=UPI00100C1C48|nr:hypothetical protein [Arcobacter sp. F2176]RXJ82645.1 hypothetical protein CRU95_00850 [Arcobacter sp. F2176]